MPRRPRLHGHRDDVRRPVLHAQLALPKSLPITRYDPASDAGCTPRSCASSASVGTGRPGWACAQKNGPMSAGSPATTRVCATIGGTPCRDTAALVEPEHPAARTRPASSCAIALRRNRRRGLHGRQRRPHRRRARRTVRDLVQLTLMREELPHALLAAGVIGAVGGDAA